MRISTTAKAFSVLACAGRATAQSWKTIPSIEAYGQHFFYSNNGSQFFIKGLAYQQDYDPSVAGSDGGNSSTTYTDPLANAEACQRDIPYMTQIFTNTIRVYSVDPTQNHDDCMQQLADNDIYVIADLGQPSISIQTEDPEWNEPIYERYTAVIDAFSKYNNVIGFFAGNEVVNFANESDAAAFVKAAIRDTKSYIKSQGYRSSLGVGYATSDVPTRNELASYFACGDESTMIDFWGYNVYSWCGYSSYEKSSYDERVEYFSDYPVPVFFAEYGCNQNIPGGPYKRPFTEVPVLFGPLMTGVFSGGIVFEYFNDNANQYGLVQVDGNSVSTYPDYDTLSSQLAKISPSSTAKSDYTPTNSALACPTLNANWSAVASPLPPPINTQLCSCEAAGFSCNVATSDETKYGDVFNYICSNDPNACAAFQHNATSGEYGALSGCSPEVQLGWAMNQYYMSQGQSASACAFSGLATTQAASTPTSCSNVLNAVGTNAQGNVPSPSGSSGGTASPSGLACSNLFSTPSSWTFGVAAMTIYVGLAVLSGTGMLLL